MPFNAATCQNNCVRKSFSELVPCFNAVSVFLNIQKRPFKGPFHTGNSTAFFSYCIHSSTEGSESRSSYCRRSHSCHSRSLRSRCHCCHCSSTEGSKSRSSYCRSHTHFHYYLSVHYIRSHCSSLLQLNRS